MFCYKDKLGIGPFLTFLALFLVCDEGMDPLDGLDAVLLRHHEVCNDVTHEDILLVQLRELINRFLAIFHEEAVL